MMITQLDNLVVAGMMLTGDLFAEDWTQGNLNSIPWLTNNLGKLACIVISAVGFGIVIFSILKNALSGLYVVNPKLFDKVDDVQKAIGLGDYAAEGALGGLTQKVPKIGSILQSLLALIPNVKALTDFDGVDSSVIDKKQYFMKAIPWLVAQIFIGMIIFYGYPAKIAQWCGNAGTTVIDLCLNNVDPVETVAGLADKMVIADFATDGSSDPYDQFVNQASKSAWRDIVGHLTDMNKQYRASSAYEVEGVIQTAFVNVSQLQQTEGWDVKIVTSYTTQEPSVATGYAQEGDLWTNAATLGQGSTITYKYWFTITGNVTTGSTMVDVDGHTDYEVITVTLTPSALKTSTKATGQYIAGFSSAGMYESKDGLLIIMSGAQYNSSKTTQSIYGFANSVTVTVYTGTWGEGTEGEVKGSFSASVVTSGSSLALQYKGNDMENIKTLLSGASMLVCDLTTTTGFKYYEENGAQSADVNLTGFVLESGRSTGAIQLSTFKRGQTTELGQVVEAYNKGPGSESTP